MNDEQLLADDLALHANSTSAYEESLQALGRFLLEEPANFVAPPNGAAHAIPDAGGRKTTPEMPLKGESVQQRVAKVNAAENSLLEAVQPLLRALSEMPETMALTEHAATLKHTLKNEINLFSVVCDEANISWKKMAIVRYCICTALDEAAHATPWGLATGWSQSNLLNHFEGDNNGGNKFFLLTGRLSMSPHEYADVLEVLLRILGLGLEGRYSILEDGDRQLTKIRQRLLTLVQSTRDTVPAILSPHALVARDQIKRRHFMLPVRVTLLLALLGGAGTFIWCKYHLSVPEVALHARIDALTHLRREPLPEIQRLRLAVLLKEEIQQKLVTVDETTARSKVVFTSDSMFPIGSATVRPEMLAILQRVAHEVARVKGQVVIVGHTDNVPINKPGLPNNQVLAKKRAEDVAQALIKDGVSANAITTEGAGDSQPVSSNNDVQGRALNRRVEIFVTY